MLRLRSARIVVFLTLAVVAAGIFAVYWLNRDQQPQDSRLLDVKVPVPQNVQTSHTADVVLCEVIAAHPGASAEEVERQVTIRLEVALAGMPGLESIRSISTVGLSRVFAQFKPDTDDHKARQEIVNRLQFAQHFPVGVVPMISPAGSREVLCYILSAPHDDSGRSIYTLHDLTTLQEWVLERELRRTPGVVDVVTVGGESKRYEIQYDSDRMARFGISLQQIQNTLSKANMNIGTDFVIRGPVAMNVRTVGLIGGGIDPIQKALDVKDPDAEAAKTLEAAEREHKPEAPQLRREQQRRMATLAAKILHQEENKRILEIRKLVLAKVNNIDVLLEDIVVGGRLLPGEHVGKRGVFIGKAPGSRSVVLRRFGATDVERVVEGIVQLQPREDPERLDDVYARIDQLNTSAGRLLPGVRIEPFYSRRQNEKTTAWVHGLLPNYTSPEHMNRVAGEAQKIIGEFPAVERVVAQAGGGNNGEEPLSDHQLLFYVGMKEKPVQVEWLEECKLTLLQKIPGVDWLVTTKDPEAMQRAFPGILAEHVLKITGPDLAELDKLANRVQFTLRAVPGMDSVSALSFKILQSDYQIDMDKCRRWGVSAADVSKAVQSAIGGKAFSSMIEGERIFDITLSVPKSHQGKTAEILDIPVDIVDNLPKAQSKEDLNKPNPNKPRFRLRDFVLLNDKAELNSTRASAIFRDQGKRILPVRFSVRGRPLAEVQADAIKAIGPLLKPPYQIEWSD